MPVSVEGTVLATLPHGLYRVGIDRRTGAVKAGPPPQPLAKLPARVDGEQVLVEL